MNIICYHRLLFRPVINVQIDKYNTETGNVEFIAFYHIYLFIALTQS